MAGAYEAELTLTSKTIALRYSYSNKPWELYIMENKPGAQPRQVTQPLSAEFKAYPWRDPEVSYDQGSTANLYMPVYINQNRQTAQP